LPGSERQWLPDGGVPEAVSAKTFSQPTARNASSCPSRFCEALDTRALVPLFHRVSLRR